ncbi:MAG: hypothetical protein HN368_09335 [Spirochaetales bacterium]|jgi:hypothetical protein|nr:hypothetical protein [Spirochaetales bacterium]
MRLPSLKESDLYYPIREYLLSQGYKVNAEVKNCDITATRNKELIIIELKTHFNATLLIQAADRQRVADAVYVALPHPADFGKHRNWKGMCNLLKRLGIGLILVHFLKSGPRVEVSFHPGAPPVRKQYKKRGVILREIRDRSGEYNIGGITRTKLITAYREAAIVIACHLDTSGKLSPAELRAKGTGKRTQSILSKNYYGWFERVDRGIYELHPEGKKALLEYPELVKFHRTKDISK